MKYFVSRDRAGAVLCVARASDVARADDAERFAALEPAWTPVPGLASSINWHPEAWDAVSESEALAAVDELRSTAAAQV